VYWVEEFHSNVVAQEHIGVPLCIVEELAVDVWASSSVGEILTDS